MTTTLPAGWKPIESAPKDGTEILAWRHDCGQFIASYTSADAFPMTQDELDAWDEETLFAKEWFTQWPQALRLEGSEIPTLWQPMPADPCLTCSGHGMVGGWVHTGSDAAEYDAEPCPECTPPATTQDAPITVSLDPDPRGVSVGVWQGSSCIYTGPHAVPASVAPGDAQDERSRVMDVIAGVWDRATQIDDAADEVIDLLRQAPAAGDALDAEPDDTAVICPSCTHQFRAIPVQVQGLLRSAGCEAPFLGATAPGALDPGHRPDLHYILDVLNRLAKADPKDRELAAALNGMRYVVSRTDTAALAAQVPQQGEA